MTTSPTEPDRILEHMCRTLAGRSTRRSFLGRAAQVLMGAVGVELVAALPFEPPGQQAAVVAQDWRYCGAYGWLCSGVAGMTNDTSCDNTGCQTGTSGPGPYMWMACCTNPATGASVYVEYHDCYTTGNPPPNNGKTIGPKGAVCDAAKDVYGFPAGARYCCSYVKVTANPCTP